MPMMPCAIWMARKCLARGSELKSLKDAAAEEAAETVADEVAAPDHALDPGAAVAAVDAVAHTVPVSPLKLKT